MGIAVIVPNVSFADANLGKVSIISDVPLQEVHIVADNFYIGTKALLATSFLPMNTGQRGLTWSITAGGSYASIDNNGLVTILPTATSKQQITVEVSSVENPNITDQKTISVLYNIDTPVFKVNKYFNNTDADTIKTNTFKPLSVYNTKFTVFADIDFDGSAIGTNNQAFGLFDNSGHWVGFGCNISKLDINANWDDRVSVANVTKVGIKREGDNLYYTIDGTTWILVGKLDAFDESFMPIGTALSAGSYSNTYLKGNMTLCYWDKIVDLSGFFS